MSKYIKCACCGKRIDIGEVVCVFDNAIFCDAHCLAAYYGNDYELSEKLAKAFGHEIFDDAQRISELKENIAEMEMKLKLMQLELAGLENPFFLEDKPWLES